MNGAVEAANKNIKKIVQKMTVTYKDWHEMLPFALHGYRTSAQTSTGATPYSLVYGMEAVVPIEFFQAEDGIRDDLVTGVQTCALPISHEERMVTSHASLCMSLSSSVQSF